MNQITDKSMNIEKIDKIVSEVVPLPGENIDTDQIVPARFLKATSRSGFGKKLFYDWRYNRDGSSNEDFVLNDSRYYGRILAAGRNFGSGSSREHAAWAIYDYGFRVVISSFFADIFRNNALNTGLLPVKVSDAFLASVFEAVQNDPSTRVRVDLIEQEVELISTGVVEKFTISSYKKECLLHGYDDVDYLRKRRPEIERWEKAYGLY